MKILLVGGGSIGKRHLKNLISIGFNISNIIVVETREDRQVEIKNLRITNIYYSIS